MTSKYLKRNSKILKAKGNIPYWVIADQMGVHENTVRNWMKREMGPEKEALILAAIEVARNDLVKVS